MFRICRVCSLLASVSHSQYSPLRSLSRCGVCVTETYAYKYRKKSRRIIDFVIFIWFNWFGMSGCFPRCRSQKCIPIAIFCICNGRNSVVLIHVRTIYGPTQFSVGRRKIHWNNVNDKNICWESSGNSNSNNGSACLQHQHFFGVVFSVRKICISVDHWDWLMNEKYFVRKQYGGKLLMLNGIEKTDRKRRVCYTQKWDLSLDRYCLCSLSRLTMECV